MWYAHHSLTVSILDGISWNSIWSVACSSNLVNFCSSVTRHPLMDHQNILLNPIFDELSFGIKFNVHITCRWGCTPLKNIFTNPLEEQDSDSGSKEDDRNKSFLQLPPPRRSTINTNNKTTKKIKEKDE